MSTVIPSSCIKATEAGCMDISELLEWGWDATKLLRSRPGDAINAVDWTVPAELTQGTAAIVGSIFYIPLSNNTGLTGVTYPVFADLTTQLGARFRLRIDITLDDITL